MGTVQLADEEMGYAFSVSPALMVVLTIMVGGSGLSMVGELMILLSDLAQDELPCKLLVSQQQFPGTSEAGIVVPRDVSHPCVLRNGYKSEFCDVITKNDRILRLVMAKSSTEADTMELDLLKEFSKSGLTTIDGYESNRKLTDYLLVKWKTNQGVTEPRGDLTPPIAVLIEPPSTTRSASYPVSLLSTHAARKTEMSFDVFPLDEEIPHPHDEKLSCTLVLTVNNKLQELSNPCLE